MPNIELRTTLEGFINILQKKMDNINKEPSSPFMNGLFIAYETFQEVIKDKLEELNEKDAKELGKIKEEEEMKAKVLMGCYDFDPKKEFTEEAKKLDKGLKALESLCKHCNEVIQSIPTKEKPEGTIQIPNAPHSLCPFIHIDGTHCPAYTELVDVLLDKDKGTHDI